MDTLRALVRVLIVLLAGCSLTTHFDDYKFNKQQKEKDASSGGGRSDAAGGGGSDAATADGGAPDGEAGDASSMPDAASSKSCTSDADCDDGNGCNGTEHCVQNLCHAGTAFACAALDDPCIANLCENDHGMPVCKRSNAREGKVCGHDDISVKAQASCARDYVCKAGKCEAQTTDTCHPDQCQVAAGCAGKAGCIYRPAPATKSCDDNNMCTESDHCSGTKDECVGTAKSCDDSVGCTVDSCDPSDGTCSNVASDALCSKPCQVGTCDMTNDCSYTPVADFTACDDGSGSTSPDFCYLGACAGGTVSVPTATCALGGCNCTAYGIARDLEYFSSKYLALWSITQSANGSTACTTGEVSAVYEVTPSNFMPYYSDFQGGSVPGSASDLAGGYAIANSFIGVISTSSQSVDWTGNYMTNALSSGTPALIHYQGAALHGEGSVLGGTTVFWLYGDDSTTATTGRLVRCSWSNCAIAPCADPTPTCVYDTAFAATTFVGIAPYTQAGSGVLPSRTYAGVVAALNFDSGTPTRALEDDNTDKNYVPSHVARADNEGSWHGLLQRAPNATLAYGIGTTNLVYCDDPEYDGLMDCEAITGVPNQANRSYFDAETTPNGGIAMLATSCTALCTSATYYLVVLPPAADARMGGNWKEYAIGTFGPTGVNTVPNQLAAGGTSIVVVGQRASAPYVQTFGTF
jgi:hypothetical protein